MLSERTGNFTSFYVIRQGNSIFAATVVNFVKNLYEFLGMQMRLNKVSELIHNSTNYQNLDSAGVSVHFQEIIDLVY